MRARLLFLLIIATLPLSIVIVGLNLIEARQELAHHRADAETFAEVLVREQVQILTGMVKTLQSVASVPALDQQENCGTILGRLPQTLPELVSLDIISRDGRVTCVPSGTNPELGAIDAGDAALQDAVTQTHPTFGAVTGVGAERVMSVYVPLPEGGAEGHVLHGTVDTSWIEKGAADLAERIGAIVLVVDRAGHLVAGHPQGLLAVGPQGEHPLLRKWQDRLHGSTDVVLDDGKTYLFSLAPVGDLGLTVAVGFEKGRILEDVYESVIGSVLVIGSSLLISAVLAIAYARRSLLMPVEALTATSRRLMAGDLGARVSSPDSSWEIADLAHSFNAMADQLQTRESQLHASYTHAYARERILAATFDTAPDPVIVIDLRDRKAGIVELCNRAGETLLGWEPGTGPGHAVEDIAAAGVLNLTAADIADCLRQEGPLCFERSGGSADPGRIWDYRLVPLRDERGQPVRIFISVHEVTADRQREAGLREAKCAAEEAAQIKDRFLAIMSHEIRTPMTAVIGLADLLAETHLDAEQGAFVRTLRASAHSLLSLLDDLLNFSKIEAGKLALEVVDTDLALLVEEVRSLFAPKASEKGLVLDVTLQAETPRYVRVDPTRLRQVLFNLLSNAIKFTEAGQVALQIAGTPLEDGLVRLQVRVQDTGIGITPEQQGMLFAPFLQGDISTTRRFGGTGLGLSISQSLVEAMGGRISVESEPGRGACFGFAITVPRAAPVQSDRPTSRPHVRARPSRILLAEDNEANLALIAAMLRRQGHDVLTATDGEQALAVLARHSVDLVLMDMQMPVMDGIAAARAIRKRPGPSGQVPIIALTADALPESRDRYLREGMNAYVTKPVDWTHLHQVIAGIVGTSDQAPAPSPPPVPGTFRTLEAELGTDAMLGLVEQLTRQLDAQLPRLADLHAEGDSEAFCQLLHDLKGAVANFGLEALSAVLDRILATARTAGPAAVSSADMEQLRQRGAEAQAIIRHWRAAVRGPMVPADNTAH